MRRFMNPMTLIVLALMFMTSLTSGTYSSPLDWVMDKIMILPAILIGLSIHEWGHAFVAYKLGDNTPKYQGRVTLNPMSHVDPMGFICLFFIGFGWGVPVEINPRNFKNPRRDELLVSVAGVVMNFIVAAVFMGLLRLLFAVAPEMMLYGTMGEVLVDLMLNIVFINLVLMVFNLLPIPPLDGFNIVTELFRLRRYEWWYKLYQNGFLILIIAILFNVTDKVLTPAITAIYTMLYGIFF